MIDLQSARIRGVINGSASRVVDVLQLLVQTQVLVVEVSSHFGHDHGGAHAVLLRNRTATQEP